MTLDQVAVGNPFVVRSLDSQGEIRRRLVDMGFVSGATGTLVRKALFGDPIEISLGTYRIAVRLSEARSVQVRPPDVAP